MDGEADIVDFGLAGNDRLAIQRRAEAAGPGTDWSADRAVAELYVWHYDKLVRMALLVTGDLPSAEDAVQGAFVSLNLRWRRLRDADKALAYLRKAVVNRALSVLRRRAGVARNTEAAARRHEPSAEFEARSQSEHSALVAALRKLSARQRAAVVLRCYGGLSEVEVGATMGISEGAVKAHASRGMAALRAELAHGTGGRQD